MAVRKKFTVDTRKRGLNLREAPSKESRVVKLLPNGTSVTVDRYVEAPEGWVAVKGGGYVMVEFLK